MPHHAVLMSKDDLTLKLVIHIRTGAKRFHLVIPTRAKPFVFYDQDVAKAAFERELLRRRHLRPLRD